MFVVAEELERRCGESRECQGLGKTAGSSNFTSPTTNTQYSPIGHHSNSTLVNHHGFNMPPMRFTPPTSSPGRNAAPLETDLFQHHQQITNASHLQRNLQCRAQRCPFHSS